MNNSTNNRVFPSIWKTEKPGEKAQNINNKKERHRQAYRDPTASAALGNIMREERRKEREKQKKQQTEHHRRR